MPRNARKKSDSGIYHVILRGINKQVIFEDDEDHFFFLDKLANCQLKSSFELYAYCLMSNHIHLLLKEGHEELGITFRRIGSSFVPWYNWKYQRVGHLFQDRFKSEAVEDDSYFLTVLRYIHQNPLKAGVVKKIQEYPWTSYREYSHKPVICNTEFALNFFSPDRDEAKKLWIKFIQAQNDDTCMEYDDNSRMSDSEAVEVFKAITKTNNPSEVQFFDPNKIERMIRLLIKNGLTLSQIARLSGLTYGAVRSIKNNDPEY